MVHTLSRDGPIAPGSQGMQLLIYDHKKLCRRAKLDISDASDAATTIDPTHRVLSADFSNPQQRALRADDSRLAKTLTIVV